MSADAEKASLLLRALAKTLDFVIIAVAVKAVPQAGYLAGFFYLIISDGLFDGRSIGKKIMRLKVLSVTENTAASFRDSVIRNLTFAIALLILKIPVVGWAFAAVIVVIEFLLMLGNKDGNRLGDYIAKTKVVEG
jgi:uncharacterized RDD family membrane protein YckC